MNAEDRNWMNLCRWTWALRNSNNLVRSFVRFHTVSIQLLSQSFEIPTFLSFDIDSADCNCKIISHSSNFKSLQYFVATGPRFIMLSLTTTGAAILKTVWTMRASTVYPVHDQY
jgi:hypothetical protein